MDSARYASANKPATMQNGGVAGIGKPPQAPILEKFRAMIREREEELRDLEGDQNGDVLGTDEIVRLYEIVLSELTINSKPIITDLTVIAGDQRAHGEGIANAICARILEVPVELKLPTLYLLDSIVKNIGKVYGKHFSAWLPEVFCDAYTQVHPNMHPAMRHLFGTWSTVFPSSVLCKIESHLQFTPSVNQQPSGIPQLRAAESPRPTHGIHVNPKYLEARRQVGHSNVDVNVQPTRATSTTSKSYGQKPSTGYPQFNWDDRDVKAASLSSHVDTLKLPTSLGGRIKRSSPPYTVGPLSPSLEEFAVDNAPTTVADRASLSKSEYDYGISRFIGGDSKQQVKHPAAFRYNNEVDLQRPRALIDAYGIDKRKDTSNHKHPKDETRDVNGIDVIGATKTWQNTEEEEFDWEDMSPTLAGHGRKNNILSSSLPSSASFRTKPTLGTYKAVPLAPALQHDWSNSAQLSVVNGSSLILQPISNLGHSSKQDLDATRGGENLSFPGSGILPSAAEQKLPLIGSSSDAVSPNQGPPFATRTRSASFDYLTPVIQFSTVPTSTGAWPPPSLHSSHVRPFLPTLQLNKPLRGQLDTCVGSNNLVMNEGMTRSTISKQLPGSTVGKLQNTLPQLSTSQSRPMPLNQHSLGHMDLLPHHSLLCQDTRKNVFPLNHGYARPAHVAPIGTILPNSVPIMPILNAPNTPMNLRGVSLPYLPRGPPPNKSQMLPVSQNPTPIAHGPLGGGAYSCLFSSLMAQGLISLTDLAPAQDSVGLEFDPDLLKVRHESPITALYADLSRQCMTCGVRFSSQEAHSSHMDWHVTKNRTSKNCKQKPSRKWFVSVNMWLTGTEGFKMDAVPSFLPTETVVETKDDKELAVPADDDQKECALCGESFDDFYSDETEEWMYKGAVYMNAPTGSKSGMDRSQLGPIVHAKCRSETGGVSSEVSRKTVDLSEEGSPRKRLRC